MEELEDGDYKQNETQAYANIFHADCDAHLSVLNSRSSILDCVNGNKAFVTVKHGLCKERATPMSVVLSYFSEAEVKR